jgi:hypothetical protein
MSAANFSLSAETQISSTFYATKASASGEGVMHAQNKMVGIMGRKKASARAMRLGVGIKL